jgi:hypothetical protein
LAQPRHRRSVDHPFKPDRILVQVRAKTVVKVAAPRPWVCVCGLRKTFHESSLPKTITRYANSSRALERGGQDVIAMPNGLAVLNMLHERTRDLLLADIVTPRIGVEVSRQANRLNADFSSPVY